MAGDRDPGGRLRRLSKERHSGSHLIKKGIAAVDGAFNEPHFFIHKMPSQPLQALEEAQFFWKMFLLGVARPTVLCPGGGQPLQ